MSRIPAVYRGPLMLPLYWRDEVSGVLPKAVEAYLNNRVDGTAISQAQVALLVEWLTHYINAPCWKDPGEDGQLQILRSSVTKLKTADDIGRWLSRALRIGLDPL